MPNSRDEPQNMSDVDHAVDSAAHMTAATADEIDGGFSDADVEAWMETAVDPIGTDQ